MKTLAVVVGNNNYYDPAKLENAINDASAIADAFRNLGYDVFLYQDVGSRQSREILSLIDSNIDQYDATIFFFAGHGFQLDGENYLTSVECQIPPGDKYNCDLDSITLSTLLNIFKRHPNKINIVIIDACRKTFGRGASEGFAPVQAPKGTLIAFSTSPDEGAKDTGYGNNSIYTGALLKYIGREMLSVEELFKKVRKTVYTISGGKQTTWEHTSLIDDFYFNVGQLVYSPQLPYSEEVIKDVNFQGKADEFTYFVKELKVQDWDRQTPALEKLLSYRSNQLDKNQQFILGRNLLQMAGPVFRAQEFFTNLTATLATYTVSGENHVLNGILYEIYFDSRGEFRKDHFKMHSIEQIMALRKIPLFKKSFGFIIEQLLPYVELRAFWMPTDNDIPVDVNVQIDQQYLNDPWEDNKQQYDLIKTIKIGAFDIIDQIRRYDISNQNELGLKKALSDYLGAPQSLITIHSGNPINRISFPPKSQELNETDF